jgi:hypothetical protein
MAASSTTTSTGRNSMAYRPLFMQQFGEFFSTVIVLFLFLVVPRRLERAFRRLCEFFSQWRAKCMITCCRVNGCSVYWLIVLIYKTKRHLPKDMSLWDDPFGAPFGVAVPQIGIIH